MKISNLSLLIVFIFAGCASSKNEKYLVGTYTNNIAQGINVVRFNSKSKELSLENVVSGIENPSFVICNKSKTIIVAVEETASNNGGKVTSYSYDKASKIFTKITSFFTKGDHPCTVIFSPKEDFILVGNYSGGNLSVFPIDSNGKLSEASNFIQYKGNSVNTARQEKPHVHCIVFHPTEHKIFVSDLGTDVIDVIEFDENTKSFLQKDKALSVKLTAGSGPRHLVWNKAGNRLYVTFELTNEVGVFEYKEKVLTQIQTLSLTAPTKNGSAAELRLSADEKYLYASVRGKDNLLVVMKTSKSGTLNEIQTLKTAQIPRNFMLTKNQKNILVAAQDSNLISVFDRDQKTGLLTATSSEIAINKPVYLFPF